MIDKISKKQRSANMRSIKSKNTAPELLVRSYLHKRGFRFSLHKKHLPGSPDIKLTKHHAVIFVNGCFWHHHEGCIRAYTPKSQTVFWENKFKENMARDKKNIHMLLQLGWRVLVVWECYLNTTTNLKMIEDWLKSSDNYSELPPTTAR